LFIHPPIHLFNPFVFAQGSPPGDGETKPNAISKTTRVSPFEEETSEDLQQALQREQDHSSPQPKQNKLVDDDSGGHSTFRYVIYIYYINYSAL
jgi:hypothetical protein